MFALTTQCSSDKLDTKPVVMISSAKQLASDTSFVVSVQMNRKVAHTLFERMRYLGSNAARKKQASRVAQLINDAETHNNASALSKEFGFVNEHEAQDAMLVIFTKRAELENRYSNYKSVGSALLEEAYRLVVSKQSDVTSSKVACVTCACVSCPFNNCAECGPGQQPDDPNGDPNDPNDPSGGSGSSPCTTACQNIRVQSEARAQYTLWAAISLACPGAAWEMGTIGMCLGGPLGAGAGGTCTAFICGTLAYANYLSEISIAENSYVTCISGCKP